MLNNSIVEQVYKTLHSHKNMCTTNILKINFLSNIGYKEKYAQ